MQTAHLKVLLNETISLRLFALQVVANEMLQATEYLSTSQEVASSETQGRTVGTGRRFCGRNRKFTRRGEKS